MGGGRIKVLLATEGTYPFFRGGVSTWCDLLVRELADIDFVIYAITGDPLVAPKYELPPNVRGLIHIPLWGVEEPALFFGGDFGEMRRKKRKTDEQTISSRFLPLLREVLRGIFDPFGEVEHVGRAFHALHQLFREIDYKAAFFSRATWEAFGAEMRASFQRGDIEELPSVYDLTVSLRWLYHYLMFLNAPIPEVDVVHTTIAGSAGMAGVIAKFEYDTPFIVTEHGIYIRERYLAVLRGDFSPFLKRFLGNLSALFTRLCYIYADQISPVASFAKKWEISFGASEDKIKVIYNGTDPSLFLPKPKPEKTRGRPTAVAAAAVMPLKDIETMIRSAAVARREVPDVLYIVYGSLDIDPKYARRCRELVRELGLEENFIFGGFHPRPYELYTEGDICVLSSISEGFPFAAIEAMACERPVVAVSYTHLTLPTKA